MKKYISSTITLLTEIAILILALLWYCRSGEEEPLIVIIASVSAIIITLFFKAKAADGEDGGASGIHLIGDKNTTVANNKKSTIQIQQVERNDEND